MIEFLHFFVSKIYISAPKWNFFLDSHFWTQKLIVSY